MAYNSANYNDNDPGGRYQAWLAAGRPNNDDNGVALDVRGAPIQTQSSFNNFSQGQPTQNQTFQNGAYANQGLPPPPNGAAPPPPGGLANPLARGGNPWGSAQPLGGNPPATGGGGNPQPDTFNPNAQPGVQTFQNGAYANQGQPPGTGTNTPTTPPPLTNPLARGNPADPGAGMPGNNIGKVATRSGPGTPAGTTATGDPAGTGNPPPPGNGQPPPGNGTPQTITLPGTQGSKPASVTIPAGSDPSKLYGPWDQYTQAQANQAGGYLTSPYPGWTPQNSGMPAYLASQFTWDPGDQNIGGGTPGHWSLVSDKPGGVLKNEQGQNVWNVGSMMNDPGKFFKDPSKVYYDKDLGWVTTDHDAVDWSASNNSSWHTHDWVSGLSVWAGGLLNAAGGLTSVLNGTAGSNLYNGVVNSFGAAGGVGANPFAPTAGGGMGEPPGGLGGMPGSGPGAGPGAGPPAGDPGTGTGSTPGGLPPRVETTTQGTPTGGPGGTPTPTTVSNGPGTGTPAPGGGPAPVIPPVGGGPGTGGNTQPPPGNGQPPPGNGQPPPGNGNPPPDNTKPPPAPSGANQGLWTKTLAFARELGIVGGGIGAFTSIYNMLAHATGLPTIGGGSPGGTGSPGGGPGLNLGGLLNTGAGLALNNQLLNFYKQQMNDLYTKGDYNAANRPGQLDKLNQFLMDPSKALDDPGYQAMRQQDLDNESRTLSARGMNMSGNEMGDLMTLSKTDDYKHINDTETQLRQAAQLGNPDQMAQAGMRSLPFMLGMMGNRNNDLLNGLGKSGVFSALGSAGTSLLHWLSGGKDDGSMNIPQNADGTPNLAGMPDDGREALMSQGMPDPSTDPAGASKWFQQFVETGNPPNGDGQELPPPDGFSSWDDYFNSLPGGDNQEAP